MYMHVCTGHNVTIGVFMRVLNPTLESSRWNCERHMCAPFGKSAYLKTSIDLSHPRAHVVHAIRSVVTKRLQANAVIDEFYHDLRGSVSNLHHHLCGPAVTDDVRHGLLTGEDDVSALED